MRIHSLIATGLASTLSLGLLAACSSGGGTGGTGGTAGAGGGGLADQPSMHATADQIAHGKYLIDAVFACGVCHTPTGADGKPDLTKYLAGSRSYQFPMPDGTINTVNAENITPHPVQGIGLWTDAQIKNGIQKGVDDENVAFWPIMPYPEYALLNDSDVFDMIALLRSIPASGNVVPADTYEPKPGDPPAASAKDADIPHTTLPASDPGYAAAERGRYLATGACIQCHTEELSPGVANFAKAYAGGRQHKSNSEAKLATSTNLTPDATGLAGWTVADIVASIKNNTDKSGTPLCAASPMGHGYMGDMTDSDMTDIATYINTLPPIKNGPFTCY
jgi:mono/diheme cytochrome c family protein